MAATSFGAARISNQYCIAVLLHLQALERVRPVLHVFGHIHEAYGTAERTTGTLAVNACTCDLNYKPSQEPVVVELQSEGSSGIDGLLGDQGSGKFKVTSVSRAWG